MQKTTMFKIALLPLLISTSLSVQAWTENVGVNETVDGETLTPVEINGTVKYKQTVNGIAKNTTLTGSKDSNGKKITFDQDIQGGKAYHTAIGDSARQLINNNGYSENIVMSDSSQLSVHSGEAKGIKANGVDPDTMPRRDDGSINYDNHNYPLILVGDEGAKISDVELTGVSRLDVYANSNDADKKAIVSNVTLGKDALSMVSGNAELDNFNVSGKFYNFDNGTGSAPVMTNFTLKNGSDARIYGDGTMVNPTIEQGGSLQFRDGQLQGAVNDGLIEIRNNKDGTGTQSLTGNFVIQKNGEIFFNENSNATLDAVSFDVAGKLRLTQDTAFDNLVLSQGNVIFEGNNQFLDLNVKSLSGSGQFFMNSAISAHDSDFITAEQGSGRFGILMKDSGLTPDSEYDLNIAHIGQGDAKFHLTNDKGLVDLGVYKYALTQTGNDWYLTPTSWLSTGSEAIVSMVDGNNKLTTESVNRVQSRLMIANAGERDNNLGANTHLWLDYDNSRLNHLRSESQYWLLNNTVTMGVDTAFSFDSGATNVFGGYVGYGQSSQRFKNINGRNDIHHTTLGIYDTYRYGQYWLSGIGQFSYLKNDVRFNTETAQSTAKFNSQYYTGSVHAGVDFTTANLTTTPYGGLMLNMGSPNDFTASNGLKTDPDNQQNVVAQIGVFNSLDYAFNQWGVTPFLDTRLSSDLKKTNHVKFNGEKVDIHNRDTSFDIDLGVKATYQNMSGFIKGGYSRSTYTENPYLLKIGMDYRF